MKKKFYFLFLMLMCLCIFAGCSDGKVDETVKLSTTEVKPDFKSDLMSQDVSANGEKYEEAQSDSQSALIDSGIIDEKMSQKIKEREDAKKSETVEKDAKTKEKLSAEALKLDEEAKKIGDKYAEQMAKIQAKKTEIQEMIACDDIDKYEKEKKLQAKLQKRAINLEEETLKLTEKIASEKEGLVKKQNAEINKLADQQVDLQIEIDYDDGSKAEKLNKNMDELKQKIIEVSARQIEDTRKLEEKHNKSLVKLTEKQSKLDEMIEKTGVQVYPLPTEEQTDVEEQSTENQSSGDTVEAVSNAIEPAPPVTGNYQAELTSGTYISGVDFPAGTYSITALSGNGNVSSSNIINGGVNETIGTVNEGYEKECVESVALPQNTTLSVSGPTVKIQSSNAFIEDVQVVQNTTAQEVSLSEGKYLAGNDFPAGKYDIIAIDGKGCVTTDNLFNGGVNVVMSAPDEGLPEDKRYSNAYAREYKNVSLTSGIILAVKGVDIKLVPST